MNNSRYDQYEKLKSKNSEIANVIDLKPAGAYYISSKKGYELYAKDDCTSYRKVRTIIGWEKYKNIYLCILDALVVICAGSAKETLRNKSYDIQNGLFKYLDSIGMESITLSEIDQDFMNKFLYSLDGVDERGVANLSEKVRNRYLTNAYTLLAQVARANPDKHLPPLTRPRGRWSGSHLRSSPIEGFSVPIFEKLYRRCIELVGITMNEFYETRDIIQAVDETKFEERSDKNVSHEHALAVLNKEFNNHVFLTDNVRVSKVGRHTLKKLIPFWEKTVTRFTPTTFSILPFIILLAIHYNPNTGSILKAKISGFRYEKIIGRNRLVWKYYKPRAKIWIVRSIVTDEEIDNPSTLLEFLLIYTKKLRDYVNDDLKDFLFLVQDRSGVDSVTESNINQNLKIFCKSQGLQTFNFSELRQTALDIASDVNHGDIKAVAVLAQHKSTDTTNNHYTSAHTKKKNRERVADGINQMERFCASKGKIDNRSEINKTNSATPGFQCADPYDSPFENKSGRLCAAYGHCPGCPLSYIDKTNPKSAAHVVNIRLTIEKSKGYMHESRFVNFWVRVIKRIDEYWLPSFPKEVIDAAKSIELPPLPFVE